MIRGRFSTGKSSNFVEVSIEVKGLVVFFFTEDKNWQWDLEACSVETPFREAPLMIRHQSGALLEIANYDQDFLKKTLKRSSRLVHVLENKKSYFLGAFLLSGLILYGIFGHGLPFLSQRISQIFPFEYGVKVDEHLISSLKDQGFTSSELSEDFKSEVREYLLEKSPSEFKNVQIGFRKMNPKMANAFALSTNHLFFTDEIFKELDSKEEVLAIYYHELGHLKKKHLLSKIINGLSFGVLSMLIVGDLTGGTESLATIGISLIGLGYDRDLEREADEVALSLLQNAEISPRCFSDALGKITKRSEELGVLKYLSTHPMPKERRDLFEEHSSKEDCPQSSWSSRPFLAKDKTKG